MKKNIKFIIRENGTRTKETYLHLISKNKIRKKGYELL